MEKRLHIIALDTPYPVDYGGRFDVFFKIVALHQAGVRITLHCFATKPEEQPELNRFCEHVYYYRRRRGPLAILSKLPYMVSSRTSGQLEARLASNDFPVLLEGIHCTAILSSRHLGLRKIILRLHNVEYLYYRQLFLSSSWNWRKWYYLNESRKLKKYEAGVVGKVSAILAVSRQDVACYERQFQASNIGYLPVFTGFEQVGAVEGKGSYCLYHGNLSVTENEQAATWLISKVFNGLGIPLYIAGRNPSSRLTKMVKRRNNIFIIPNPSWLKMQELIREAQIHAIPSFNKTGVKLKLLNALYNGRHCVTNSAAINGTELHAACHIADSAEATRAFVEELFRAPFSKEDIAMRERILNDVFNTQRNVSRLIQSIW